MLVGRRFDDGEYYELNMNMCPAVLRSGSLRKQEQKDTAGAELKWRDVASSYKLAITETQM